MGDAVPLASIEDIAESIEILRRSQPRSIVAISGYGGAGKSTLAKALASSTGSTRLRGDDFLDPYRSHHRSTDWVDVDLTTAGERGRERDRTNGHDHDQLWTDVWLPNDRDFAARFDPRGRADVLYVPADVAPQGMPDA